MWLHLQKGNKELNGVKQCNFIAVNSKRPKNDIVFCFSLPWRSIIFVPTWISVEFLKTWVYLYLCYSLPFACVSCHHLVSPAWVVLRIPYQTPLSSPDFITNLCKKRRWELWYWLQRRTPSACNMEELMCFYSGCIFSLLTFWSHCPCIIFHMQKCSRLIQWLQRCLLL